MGVYDSNDGSVTLVVRTVHNWYGHEMPKDSALQARYYFKQGNRRVQVNETVYNTDHILSIEVLARTGIV